MNFIAALLLVVSQDEERAFWMFVCAFDALGVEGYYTEGMTLLRADMQVLASCMQAKCAKVSRTLNQFNVDLLAICSEWYITWFAKSLPVSTVLRVWDALFFEGFKVLFRVSMGIFKQIEQEVLKSDGFDAIMQQAKCWPRSIVEHNELMKASFQGLPYFKRQQLRKAREQALCRIEKEDQERKRAAKARQEAQESARKNAWCACDESMCAFATSDSAHKRLKGIGAQSSSPACLQGGWRKHWWDCDTYTARSRAS